MNSTLSRCLSVPLTVMLAGLGSVALASTLLPDPEGSVYLAHPGSGVVGTASGGYTSSYCSQNNSCFDSTSFLFYGNGYGSTSVTGNSNDPTAPIYAQAYADTTLTYWFGVFGSFSGATVPIRIQASAAATATAFSDAGGNKGAASGLAKLTIDDPNETEGPSTLVTCQNVNLPGSGCLGTPTLNLDFMFDLIPNQTYLNAPSITMEVTGFARGGTFSAFIDPTISFAPGFDSTGLSLEFSPDLPSLPTPEPGGLLLLASGIAILLVVRPASLSLHSHDAKRTLCNATRRPSFVS